MFRSFTFDQTESFCVQADPQRKDLQTNLSEFPGTQSSVACSPFAMNNVRDISTARACDDLPLKSFIPTNRTDGFQVNAR